MAYINCPQCKNKANDLLTYCKCGYQLNKLNDKSEYTEKDIENKSNNISYNEVVVTDIKMSFGSMVVFMVKWVIASIPAVIILFLISSVVGLFLGMVVEILFGGELFQYFS